MHVLSYARVAVHLYMPVLTKYLGYNERLFYHLRVTLYFDESVIILIDPLLQLIDK